MEFCRDGIRLMAASGIRESTRHVLNKKKPVGKRVSCPKSKIFSYFPGDHSFYKVHF